MNFQFQKSVPELLQIAGTLMRGKLRLPEWLRGAVTRMIVLTGGTTVLLMARIKVMGAQLPVFTRWVGVGRHSIQGRGAGHLVTSEFHNHF